ncbi:hypothetical protein EC973_004591 [Apophysomyces ossiformis]|uniref:Sey1/RHD3-like three-helix bundle domain-containing protein n=1 Tax=Apophysomyces ossiformis TaxID=679940 RepID=A0A8H7ET65_9FUNG|nr:hypothetical protein EC973_004591 [Apophysomyces ossiformis]
MLSLLHYSTVLPEYIRKCGLADVGLNYSVDAVKRVKAEDVIPDLGKRMQKLLSEIRTTSGYNEDIYQKKKAELLARIKKELHEVFVGRLKNLRKQAIRSFSNNLKNLYEGFGSAAYASFKFLARLYRAAAEDFFLSEFVQAALWRNASGHTRMKYRWSYQDEYRLLKEDLDEQEKDRFTEAELRKRVTGGKYLGAALGTFTAIAVGSAAAALL